MNRNEIDWEIMQDFLEVFAVLTITVLAALGLTVLGWHLLHWIVIKAQEFLAPIV